MKLKCLVAAIVMVLGMWIGNTYAADLVIPIMGKPAQTSALIASTDTAQNVITAYQTSTSTTINMQNLIGFWLTLEGNNIRVSFGVNATTTVGHLVTAGQSLFISDNLASNKCTFISAVGGVAGNVVITPMYKDR